MNRHSGAGLILGSIGETVMIQHLNQVDLSRRWKISPRTLERWRWAGCGPRYIKVGGRGIYRLEDIEAYEAGQMFNNTAEFAATRGGIHGR